MPLLTIFNLNFLGVHFIAAAPSPSTNRRGGGGRTLLTTSSPGLKAGDSRHMIWHNLNSHEFRIVFCCHLAFLVFVYIPMPKAGGLRSIWVRDTTTEDGPF